MPAPQPSAFTPDERTRYARHFALPEVGPAGQERLKSSSVLLIGAGGLGSPAALYLAAAGVGRLGIIDPDTVSLSNLQRQILFTTADLRQAKTEAAAQHLHAMNPHVHLNLYPSAFSSANAPRLVAEYDVILDGADNFPTRYLANDAAILGGKPLVHASVFRFEGSVSVFGHAGGPCYRCLFPEPPPPGAVPDCASGGVLGVLPGIVGSLQAAEALKLILGIGAPLGGRLLMLDVLRMQTRELPVARDPNCPLCGANPSITTLKEIDFACSTSLDTESSMPGETPDAIHASDLPDRLKSGNANATLLDVREDWEWQEGRIPGAVHIPLGQLPDRLAELDPNRETLIYCHLGGRSARAQQFLREQGFQNVINVAGGIAAWPGPIES